jgi:DNA polymerase
VDAEARRNAREFLNGEMAGGRWLLAPRETGGTAGASPSAATDEQAERLKRFREQKAQREARDRPAAEAAQRAAQAPPPRGLTARHDESIFGSHKLTDPAQPAAGRLEAMREQVAACRRCAELATTRKQTVFGDGRPGVELLFVGEAPGADEDAQGVPFVGRAGQLLNKIIAAMGLERGGVYICNVLKCRPPNNRTPLPAEAANCWPFLCEQIEIVAPRVICALGAPAARTLLGTEEAIGRLRGAVHDFHGTPLVATYHPAYLLRNPPEKVKVWEDMKLVLRLLGRPVPERQARS